MQKIGCHTAVVLILHNILTQVKKKSDSGPMYVRNELIVNEAHACIYANRLELLLQGTVEHRQYTQ